MIELQINILQLFAIICLSIIVGAGWTSYEVNKALRKGEFDKKIRGKTNKNEQRSSKRFT